VATPSQPLARELKFRDPGRARALTDALGRLTAEIGRAPVSVMHVCGSHEQAIAKFGLRAVFPKALNVIMGPGCPVCVTDTPEVDEGVVLAGQGVRIATYGDMLRVPGTVKSLSDAQTEGARIDRHGLSVPASYTVVFFMIALTSIGLTRSEAVQPSRL